jgi:hypothetical protein
MTVDYALFNKPDFQSFRYPFSLFGLRLATGGKRSLGERRTLRFVTITGGETSFEGCGSPHENLTATWRLTK